MLPTYSHSRRASPDGSPEVAKKTRIKYPKRRSFLSSDEPKLHLSDLSSRTAVTGTKTSVQQHKKKRQTGHWAQRQAWSALQSVSHIHTEQFTQETRDRASALTNVDNCVAGAQKRERAAQLAPLEVALPVSAQVRGKVAWLKPDLCAHEHSVNSTHAHRHWC